MALPQVATRQPFNKKTHKVQKQMHKAGEKRDLVKQKRGSASAADQKLIIDSTSWKDLNIILEALVKHSVSCCQIRAQCLI